MGLRWIVPVLAALMLAWPAAAQELFVNGGITRNTGNGTEGGHWSVSYIHGVGRYGALSLTYLNEGHVGNHRRDGVAVQGWGHMNALESPLSLALGVGPYVYFDTEVAPVTEIYQNSHGLGIVSSATATWYGLSPLLIQGRIDHVYAHDSFNSLSASLGIGYLLDVPVSPGVPFRPVPVRRTSDHEITVYAGRAVLNSAKSENNNAFSVEYRRGIFNYVDWTVAWLTEGRDDPIGRYGVTAKLWLVHPIVRRHLEVGVGAGPYLAYDRAGSGERHRAVLAADVSIMAVYWFLPPFGLRAAWSRIVTGNSRDTDIFLGGVTYRF